ncbi:MAG: phospholipase [Actinomycetota bacterium]|nr:phospholipase [Actinomycetota bacterium]
MSELIHERRPPASDANGALILFHGRGADEQDLFPLFDLLDPKRRLLGLTPRGPVSLPPGGAHWYAVREVGYPDPKTFHPTFERAARWLEGVLAENSLSMEKTVLGGFSQGAVMAYSLALEAARPRPAAIMAFSGFVPTVDDLSLPLDDIEGLKVAIGHGIYDPIIGVEWGRKARDLLTEAGADVFYRESPIPHAIDPEWVAALVGWLDSVISGSGGDS